MVLVQNWPFFNLVLRQYWPGNVFYDNLQRKKAFLGYKKRSLKSQKTDSFRKGLVHGFGLKLAIFPPLFFRQYMREKRFFILEYDKTHFLTLYC